MIKLRDAGYCNLKLFLIYLTTYGHLIEPQIAFSPALAAQYQWIYLFHMPLFAFLSGLFLRDRRSCLAQCRKSLLLYAALQGTLTLFSGGRFHLFRPAWILWYLLSLAAWAGAGTLYFRFPCRRAPLLATAIFTGCAAGCLPFVGRTLSLSRTLAFFPFFLLGLMIKPDFPWKKLRPLCVPCALLTLALVRRFADALSPAALYCAEPYADPAQGICLRLVQYFAAFSLGLTCLCFAPRRRVPFTKAGCDTLPLYLLHAPPVLLLRELEVPPLLCPAAAAAILYVIYQIARWRGELFAVIAPEGRKFHCLPFRTSTKSTPARSIDSCCP